MSLLNKALVAVGIAAVGVGAAFFVGAPAAPTEVASCWAENASPEQKFKEGHHPGSLARDACLALGFVPSLRASVGADLPYAAEVTKALAQELRDSPEFRQGQYAALAEESTLLPAVPALAAGELGMLMEKAAATRLAALSCGIVTEVDVQGVGQFDSLLALSVAGERIGMPTLDVARAFTDKMLKRAVDQALARAPATPSCDQSLQEALTAHLKEWQLFAEGKHPWAEGCRPEVTTAELVLRCS